MKLKKGKKVFLFLCISTLFLTTKVSAECDYQGYNALRTNASYVEAKYQLSQVIIDEEDNERPDIPLTEGKVPEGEYAILNKVTLNVINIPDSVYITLENITDGEKNTYYPDDLEDGTLTYQVPDVTKIREYVIKVYSNEEDCHKDEELNKITIKTPMYNYYSDLNGCVNNNKYYCQEFITEEIPDPTEILFEDYENPNEKTEEQDEGDNKGNQPWIWIGTSIGVILLISIVGVIIFKKKRDTKF